MTDSTRKITHYCIKIFNTEDNSVVDPIIIDNIFKSVMKLDKTQRKLDFADKSRFHLIYTYKSYGTHSAGLFKSAKYNHRPGLIDKESMQERDNPKKHTEGEGESTHFSIKFKKEEAYLLLESRRDGIGVTTFKQYIETLVRHKFKTYKVKIGISLKENFERKLENLNRVMRIEAYTPYKQVVDTFGDIAVEEDDIKNNAIIKFTAKKKHTLEQFANGLYQALSNNNTNVSRLRIYGKTENDSDVLLDTESLKDHDIVSVKLDDNRQVISSTIIPQLITIAENL